MQIVIPMVGVGSRFAKKGYAVPKPLIEVHGKPMIEYVVDLFPGESNFVFICNKEHLEKTDLRKVLKKLKPESVIVEMPDVGSGPAHNFVRAADHVKDDEPIVVNYCDFDMYWDWNDFKKQMADTNLSSFTSVIFPISK